MRLDPRRILIVLQGSIGDVTRALPLANVLREAYPQAKIAWAIEATAFPLIERHPAVDEPIVLDRKQWRKTLGPFLRRIREGKFDLVLDLQRILKSGLISWWSAAPFRLGFHRDDAKECNWLFNNHYIPRTGNGISKLAHYAKFADYLGISKKVPCWRLSVDQAEEKRTDELLRGVKAKFVVYFVGSRWESKQWFPLQTAICATEVHRRHGLPAVLLGTAADAVVARQVEEAVSIPVANLAGRTSLREAIAILGRAAVAVGPDTGLMHVAAALGTPVVSLWGATSPERTGPHGFQDFVIRGRAPCSPCYLRRCPIDRICMQSIDPDEVATKVEKALSQRTVGYGLSP